MVGAYFAAPGPRWPPRVVSLVGSHWLGCAAGWLVIFGQIFMFNWWPETFKCDKEKQNHKTWTFILRVSLFYSWNSRAVLKDYTADVAIPSLLIFSSSSCPSGTHFRHCEDDGGRFWHEGIHRQPGSWPLPRHGPRERRRLCGGRAPTLEKRKQTSVKMSY